MRASAKYSTNAGDCLLIYARLYSGGLTTVLQAQVPASDIASAGTATVTVFNPSPGGGTSAGVSFNIGSSSPTTSEGVDYSVNPPDLNELKAAGYGFVIRYVSAAGNAKNITSSEAQALQAAGLGIILVFESTATEMQNGYSAGVGDANTAVATATAAGAPQNFFCYFACDFDAQASDQTAINAYLDGAASVLGVQRVGFYGGYYPLKSVLDAGKASKGWQTTAWSGGNIDSRISLYQYLYNQTSAGGSYDIDEGFGSDLGQWSVSPTRVISLSGNLAFGSVAVGSSPQSTLTINNIGNATLTVSSISYPSGFSGNWSGTIAASGSQPVTVTFSPTSAITYGGTVTVNSDATSGVNTIATSGTGTVTPTKIISLSGNLAFGSVAVGSSPQSTLTINNTGNATLTVSSISYPSGFSGNWSGTIAGGGLQPVTVTFSPTSATTYGGTVTVNSDATSGVNTISASGAGTVAPTKTISLSGNLAFGSVPVGSSPQSTLTINNTGNATLTVTSISYPSGFSGNWSGTIAGGGSQPVTVTFSPTSATAYGGTVTVNSDATSGVNTITASGAGTVTPTKIISLSGNLTFGSVAVGLSPQSTLTINNTGNATLTVSSITYPGGFSGIWSGTIAAGSSQPVTVTFSPTSATSYGGTVTVNSDATSGVNTITASGTGTATSIISLGGDLAFGAVSIGSPVENLLTIRNSGTVTLNVSSLTCPTGFSGSFSGSISPGSFSYALITFTPTLPASYGGAIVVNSDAGSGTNTIAVSGIGTSTDPIHNPPIQIGATMQSGNALVMTWPTNAVGFQLEFSTNLGPAAIWTPVGTAATIINGQNVFTNPITGHVMFFRLHQ